MSSRDDDAFEDAEGQAEAADLPQAEADDFARSEATPPIAESAWDLDPDPADLEQFDTLLQDFNSISTLNRALDRVQEAAGRRRRALQARIVILTGVFAGTVAVSVLLMVWNAASPGVLASVLVGLTVLATGAAIVVSVSAVRQANILATEQEALRQQYTAFRTKRVRQNIERAARSVGFHGKVEPH